MKTKQFVGLVMLKKNQLNISERMVTLSNSDLCLKCCSKLDCKCNIINIMLNFSRSLCFGVKASYQSGNPGCSYCM